MTNYEKYLASLKVGDKVYPGYDGKGGRATCCEIVSIEGNKIAVKGCFWGEKEIEVTASFADGVGWVKYSEEPTLMELLGVTDEGEEGDYYRLFNPEYLKECYNQEYLRIIGLAK